MPRCGGANTTVLAGGHVLCSDCTEREIKRTMLRDAVRIAEIFDRAAHRVAFLKAIDV